MARFATFVDRDEIVRICTHPDVRRWTACDGAPEFDPDRWLSKGLVVLTSGGCFLANPLDLGVYACHTNVVPEARGHAVASARAALRLAFVSSDVQTFYTAVPDNNHRAAALAQAMGFRRVFHQDSKWRQGGLCYGLAHWRLDIDDWILAQESFEADGRAFHDEAPSTHTEDPVHDKYVGAVGWMLANGNVDKAATVYNRWARMAGYALLKVMSYSPAVLDAGDFEIHCDEHRISIHHKEHEHARDWRGHC